MICQAATRGVRHLNLSCPSLPGSSATARHSHSNPRGPWPLRIVPCIIFRIPVSCRTHTHSIPLTISRCQALRKQKAFVEYPRSHMFQAQYSVYQRAQLFTQQLAAWDLGSSCYSARCCGCTWISGAWTLCVLTTNNYLP